MVSNNFKKKTISEECADRMKFCFVGAYIQNFNNIKKDKKLCKHTTIA